jgi:hypothetical protein
MTDMYPSNVPGEFIDPRLYEDLKGPRRVPTQLKSISAVKKQPSGHANRKKAESRRRGENVGWHRIVDNLDDAIRKLGNNPDVGSPVTRWVYFGHLTKTQGMAGRRYADIMRKFDRFHTGTKSRTARAQSYDNGRGGEDQELAQRAFDGTMDEYEIAARKAMRAYKKLHKVVSAFPGAREMLDNLCVLEIEPPADQRASCAAVLSLVAKAFGIDEGKGRR